jgi:plastocyanin
MRRIAALAAIAAALVFLVGCGGDDEPEAAATPTATETPTAAATEAATETPTEAASGASTLKIEADPGGAIKFTKTDLTAKAGEVTIDFSNQSQVPHAVDIEGVDGGTTETVTGADAKPITVDLKPGEYTFYCPVGDHRAEGMEGKLIVR